MVLNFTTGVWFYPAFRLSLSVAQDLCSSESTNKLNYGAKCNGSSECRTGVCNFSRCSCSSSSFYDDYSTSCVPKCGSNLCSDGLIVSPADLYPQDSTCYWNINGSSGTYVTLVVGEIDMYSFDCSSNYLTVTDSNSYPLVNNVCYRNYIIPTVVASSDNYMRINYVSAYSRHRGFRGQFYIRDNFTSLSELSGYIASPGFPVEYPGSSNYTWLISGKPGNIVTLSILSAFTECRYDMVRVYDGPSINSPLLVSLCDLTSESVAQDIISSTSQILINFITDGSIQHTGFSAFYVTHGRPYNQPCNDTGQCADNFICINSQCGCHVDQYYDTANQTCLNGRPYGYGCFRNYQCGVRFNCVDGKCICLQNQYFQNSTSTCMTRLDKGQECNRSDECQDSLTCINGSCECTPGQYYHRSLRTCRSVLTFGSVCDASIRGMCKSPDFMCTPNITKGLARCLCPNNTYFDDDICTDSIRGSSLKLSYNQTEINLSNLTDLNSMDVSWTAVDDSLDHGSIFTGRKVINMSGLTPGQEYWFTLQLHFTSDGNNLNDKDVTTQFSIVTIPAAPGQLKAEQSNLRQPPYILRFSPSPGFVKTYQITLYSVDAHRQLAFFYIDVDESPVPRTPDGSNVQMTLIALTCVGWIIAIVAMVIICVQCFRIKKITRHGCPKTKIEIEKQIQPRSEGRTLSEIKPVTTNNKREVPTSLGTVPPTSPINSVTSFNSSVYVNDSYRPDALGEAKDDLYVEILHVSNDHLYNNK
ncbi:hypothetical protein Btru_024611 [Bulinus truncatus]|nr:hypothetical protein Btru_024611 [Bulinus truncatus]